MDCDEPGCCPPPADVPPSPTSGEAAEVELAALARALGHPARVRILRLLIRRGGCICKEIGDEIDLAPSTISQHLKQLREVGLIRGAVDGPRICYCVEPAMVARLRALVDAL